jgi:hypothetical protein
MPGFDADECGVLKGRGFMRAAENEEEDRALAPEGWF